MFRGTEGAAGEAEEVLVLCRGLLLQRGLEGSSSVGAAAACASETVLPLFLGCYPVSAGVLIWLRCPFCLLVSLFEAVDFLDRRCFLKLKCLAAVSVVSSEHAFLRQSHQEGISSSYMLS